MFLAGSVAIFGLSAALAQAPAAAPPPFAAPPFKNLKVLPADISRANLLQHMKLFSQSLGVRCSHCHVGEEGKPLSSFDFASDAKPAKDAARRMLAMVRRINSQDFGVAEVKDAKVTCFTCHRGSPKPATVPPDPARN